MQATGLFKNIERRPEIKVIGVAENDLCLYIVNKLLLANGFYCPAVPTGMKMGVRISP